MIAEQFGTLESLYPGRIDLGLGRAPGTDSATSYAIRRGLSADGHDFPELLAELQRYLGQPESDLRVRAYPGTGLNIPIWLLGSSTFSARLAAELGLPFAFASHFAPDELDHALKIYRGKFQPSENLQKPYVMVGVPVIAAETDALANKLVTTTYQKFLGLVRREPVQSKPPVDNIDAIWNAYERAAVLSRMAIAAVGSPETVEGKLNSLLSRTGADELMMVSDFYDFQDRLNSYEILSTLWHQAQKPSNAGLAAGLR
jgi:luciferase family oxidoreductase group 1